MSDLTTLLSEMFCVQIFQVTLLILLVGLVARLFLRNRPFCAGPWTIVLIKCVTPPILFSPYGVFCRIGTGQSAIERTDRILDARCFICLFEWGSGVGGNRNEDKPRCCLHCRYHWRGDLKAGTRQWHSFAVVIWLAGAFGMLVVNVIRTALFLRRLRESKRLCQILRSSVWSEGFHVSLNCGDRHAW